MPARARASAIARPTRTAPPVTSARGRCGVILKSVMSSRVKNWFKVRFIAGFFFTVPVFLTAWLLWIFWSRIDDVFFPMYEKVFGRAVPGLGFLTAIAIILLMGTIARNVVGRRVLAWGDKLLLRVPIYRRLYPSIKLLIDSFSPERRSAFASPSRRATPRPPGCPAPRSSEGASAAPSETSPRIRLRRQSRRSRASARNAGKARARNGGYSDARLGAPAVIHPRAQPPT